VIDEVYWASLVDHTEVYGHGNVSEEEECDKEAAPALLKMTGEKAYSRKRERERERKRRRKDNKERIRKRVH
jgi:hypothetical protein